MTVTLSGSDIATKIEAEIPGSVVESTGNTIFVKNEMLLQTARYLKITTGLDFNYLNFITVVDYQTYFEVIYELVSLDHNHRLVLKTKVSDREKPVLDSVVSLWKGADFQEREIFDLFGINFTGHPNMKRIFLWEGFQGYPLRKDFRR